MKRDVQATAIAGFKESDSFIFKDGREWLVGKDWDSRKNELWLRANYQCEFIAPQGLRCKKEAVHPHHKVKRSKAHDDRLSNLLALCDYHHRMMHPELQVKSDRAAHRQPLSGNELEAT